LNSMRNEVDYRLAKILFADMCSKGVIRRKKDKDSVRRTMLDQYAPPFAFLEKDESEQSGEDELIELMGSKLRCGKCNRGYGVRPWHSTSYNDRVYECRSKNIRKGFCGNSHIYEEFLPEVVKSIIRLLIKNRHIAEQFIVKTHRAYSPELLTEVHRYLGFIISSESVDFAKAEDELNYIISELVVNDRLMEVRLIDGTSFDYEVPDYTPRRMK